MNTTMARNDDVLMPGAQRTRVAVVHRYRRRVQWGLCVATACLLLVTVLLLVMFSADGWNAPMIVCASVMIATTVAAGLLTAASVWNSVRVQVIASDILIVMGPVPWTRRRIIPGAMIEQLYVEQAPLEKSLIPRLGGPFDVKARLSDGRWLTVVCGCRSEHDAREVESTIERALDRENESGAIEDDERSEVFANWRESLQGGPPSWLRIEQGDGETRIVCRNSTPAITAGVVATAPWVVLGLYVLGRAPSAYGIAVWSLLAVVALLVLIRTILWRQVLVIGPDHVSRRTRGLFGSTRPDVIDRSMIESLDCRSHTIVKRVRKFGAFRIRRYEIVACTARAGTLRLVIDLPSRDGALHALLAIASALDVPVRA